LENAHRKCARFGHAQAIIRCGQPVQLQLSEGFFVSNRAKRLLPGSAMGILQIARGCNSAGDLPDVSKCFCGAAQSILAGDTMLLCMGLFSIFWLGGPWLQSVFALPSLKLRRTSFDLTVLRGCATRTTTGSKSA
jgi:hypothetical protein